MSDFVFAFFYWCALPLLAFPLRFRPKVYNALAGGVIALALLQAWVGSARVAEVLLQCLFLAAVAATPRFFQRRLAWVLRNAAARLDEMKRRREEKRRDWERGRADERAHEKTLTFLQDQFSLLHVVVAKMEPTDILQALGNAWKNRAGVRGSLLLCRRPNGNWDVAHCDGVDRPALWPPLLADRASHVHFHSIQQGAHPEKHPLLAPLAGHLRPPYLLVPFVWEQMVLALGYLETDEAEAESLARNLDLEARFVSLSLRRAQLYDLMRERSRHDALTGVFLRGVLMERLRESLRKFSRYKTAFAFVLLDIDLFKEINDRWGHLVGDKILVHLTQTIRRLAHPGILVARYGGDEFALLLEMEKKGEAVRWVEELRNAVQNDLVFPEGPDVRYTVSVGVALVTPENASPEVLVESADKALYEAKRAGRNRVVIKPA